jgi:hypothetical protein
VFSSRARANSEIAEAFEGSKPAIPSICRAAEVHRETFIHTRPEALARGRSSPSLGKVTKDERRPSRARAKLATKRGKVPRLRAALARAGETKRMEGKVTLIAGRPSSAVTLTGRAEMAASGQRRAA